MVATHEASEAVRAALATASSLDAWARRRGERARRPGGRGAVHVATLGGRRVAVRHARRGGWMRPLGDRYFDRPPRPFVELAVSEGLRAAGVRTPRVVAALVASARPGYRGDLATEWLEPGHDLLVLLAPNVYPHDLRRAGLAAAGREVGRAHAAGLDHPDLNLGNLFVQPVAGDRWTAWLLDLDRASIGPPSGRTAGRNLDRFARSLDKERRGGRIVYDPADLAAFTAGHRDVFGRTDSD